MSRLRPLVARLSLLIVPALLPAVAQDAAAAADAGPNIIFILADDKYQEDSWRWLQHG